MRASGTDGRFPSRSLPLRAAGRRVDPGRRSRGLFGERSDRAASVRDSDPVRFRHHGGAGPRHSTAAPAAATSKNQAVALCGDCHEDQARAFPGNPHARPRKGLWGAGPGTGSPNALCESCHGDGTKHIESSGDKAFIRGFRLGQGRRRVHDVPRGVDEPLVVFERSSRQLPDGALHHVPFGSLFGREGGPPSRKSAGRLVRDVPSDADRALPGEAVRPSPRSRRDGLHLLPRSPRPPRRQGRSVDADGRAPLPRLPRREERAVRLRARGGRGRQLHDLPRAARIFQPEDARPRARRPSLPRVPFDSLRERPSAPSLRRSTTSRLPRYQNCTTCHAAIHGSNLSPQLFK